MTTNASVHITADVYTVSSYGGRFATSRSTLDDAVAEAKRMAASTNLPATIKLAPELGTHEAERRWVVYAAGDVAVMA